MSAVPYVRVLISPELKEQFSQIAAHQDRAVSQVLRDLMREYIWRTSQARAPLNYGRIYWRSRGDSIRAVIDTDLKAEFDAAARKNGVLPSRALRDLVSEYVRRHSRGEIWEPGVEIKRKELAKGGVINA
ncbi:hypothetical protein [Paracoccus sp. J56]|jgi:antitoxin component of RelBE/YafQ-DinJ toxin-antitoxin module|uniref:hypothetical protein n=1 Tax=Paracoccus sp. J56 TaxID=935850 RepID=UPI000A0B26F7|nr:hypothetical protein [Paracoccus sp. J56]EDH5293464.1 hypothetical protein [Salmonella enterica subsp. enterica serovar Senftenberg]EDI2310957.1 hypothetical protein [Salmonella enterica subsp. enterica serovar Senftenberg]SMG56546.1 hypothetical protein SAMN02746000_03830 [Paracoccus sp. J56]